MDIYRAALFFKNNCKSFNALFICCYIKVETPGLLIIDIVQMVCKADAVQPLVDCRVYHQYRVGIAVTRKHAVHVLIPHINTSVKLMYCC